MLYIRKVASFTDAWIETEQKSKLISEINVASFTDAWIETQASKRRIMQARVASFTDAWIETNAPLKYTYIHCRIFYRCVD